MQGDGLIISTSTGSTAYNMASGGSIVYNEVPCILLTPICPHSLSFRPLILPKNVTLQIKVPETARNGVWVGVDGSTRFELNRGEILEITTSEHPVPCNDNL